MTRALGSLFCVCLLLMALAASAVAALAADAPAASKPVADDPWACLPCHKTTTWASIQDGAKFDHARTGTPLAGAHARARCSGCHRPAERSQPQVPRACAECHRDPHRGELGDSCSDCHSATNWLAPRTLPSHESSRFPLTGAHTITDCRSCHTRLGGTVYRGTPSVCGDCHLAQAMAVKAPDHRLAGFGPGCQPCHGTFAWAPARVNHATWWPLEGKHAAQTCDSCHKLSKYRGVGTACSSCHSPLLAKAVPDHKAMSFGNSCENCHTAISWHVLQGTWHDAMFPTSSGSHTRVTCGGCHGGGYDLDHLACTSCHSHKKSSMDSTHGSVHDYQWLSKACYACHPKG